MSENVFELTPEEEFKLRFERYFPEFFENLKNDTLDTNEELKYKSLEMSDLAEKAGIDMGDFIMKYIHDRGLDSEL